jgi:hypothetical protein
VVFIVQILFVKPLIPMIVPTDFERASSSLSSRLTSPFVRQIVVVVVADGIVVGDRYVDQKVWIMRWYCGSCGVGIPKVTTECGRVVSAKEPS